MFVFHICTVYNRNAILIWIVSWKRKCALYGFIKNCLFHSKIKSELNIGSLAHFLFPLIHFKCKRNTCSKEHGRCNTAQYWENNSGLIFMRELDLPWINILQLDLLETTHSTHILTNTQTRNGIKKKLTIFLRCFSNTRKNCFLTERKKTISEHSWTKQRPDNHH